ncbi:MAG: leucine--tRNA ligase [Candidatus Bathyarchaeia archaeon]
MSQQLDFERLERKWQSIWEERRLFEADPDPSKEKFYITVAYPYPNSPQHIGHGRTYTITDVYARYKRMRGYNVLFPMAFHYTGTPILAMAKRIEAGDEELLRIFTDIYGIPKERLSDFKDPLAMAKYFHEEIKDGMRRMGYSIDWRREFTTIDPQYGKFIEWQFKKLFDKGLISKGSHPVGWCPSCRNPVGQHDTQGDVEPEIIEFTVIKFESDGIVLPTATLRPETVFGVTNLWVNPDGAYVKAKVGREVWIVSEEASGKLEHLNFDVEVLERIPGRELIGLRARNPLTGGGALVLPASFVDTDNGTGLVMSVPAHAPFDYAALEEAKARAGELKEAYGIEPGEILSLAPIPLIECEGYSKVPAEDIVKRLGIKGQMDPNLKRATEILYSDEFHRGRTRPELGQYGGLPVKEAREKVKRDLLGSGRGDLICEIANKPVFCRCGAKCTVKILSDQWFIDYANQSWKELAKECLSGMAIIPEDLRREFEYTIDWLKERACARQSGLGTKLPWDRNWIIESLSDSVIYMAYYTIAKQIKEHGIDPSKLGEEIFDYIFLGRGDAEDISKRHGIERAALEGMRAEFSYFYPLDSRHSGRDLIPNHLTFFIFNHAAIFPRDKWPRQIVVNGSVLYEGKKMSKSLGNILPLKDAIRKYGADTLRLALLSTAELMQDVNFSEDLAESLRGRLTQLYRSSLEFLTLPPRGRMEHIDKWLLSRLQRVIESTTQSMEALKVRDALNHPLFLLEQDIQWYLKRCKALGIDPNGDVLREVVSTRLRLLAPYIPYICEELWERMGNAVPISISRWPEVDGSLIDPAAEAIEELVKGIYEDVKEILRVIGKIPKLICLYRAAEWKWRIREAFRESGGERIDVPSLIAKAGAPRSGEAMAYAARALKEFSRAPEGARKGSQSDRSLESKALEEAASLLSNELRAEVKIWEEGCEGIYDPIGKAKQAQPLRPAIYME